MTDNTPAFASLVTAFETYVKAIVPTPTTAQTTLDIEAQQNRIEAIAEKCATETTEAVLDGYDPTQHDRFTRRVESIVESALDDFDPTECTGFDDAVERAVENFDFDDRVQTAVNDYDFSSHIKDAIDDYDFPTSGSFNPEQFMQALRTDEKFKGEFVAWLNKQLSASIGSLDVHFFTE